MAQITYGTITITDTTDIESIKNWYLATNASSGVDKATSGWTDTIQQMTASKQYLWNYEQILGANNTEISSTLPVIIGHYGINGLNGTDGNSITSIDEYYQATSSTTNPGSSGWQKNTLVTPTSTNKYLWNYQVINYSKTAAEGSYNDARIIGVYGDKGEPGNPGTNGINTATVYLYQRAASAPTKPSGSLTYTFSSAEITSGTLGNWKQSIGELTGTDPIWVIAAVASSNGATDTIASTEWSTQIKLAQNGTDGQPGGQGAAGLNQATVFIYKRASSSPNVPNNSTYTFATGNFTLSDNTWSKIIPASDGNPCYVTSAVAIGNGTTATLTWNTPSVLVEDGIDGISPTVTSTSNGVKIVDADGNETYITNGANGQSYYTYIRYSANSNGSGMVTTPTSSTKYIGVYSGTSSTVPAYTAFTWSKYVGDPGTPATQYYAFVKYATDANGSNMQDSPDSTHIYVGTYTGTSSSPAASAYQWSKYVGDPGTPATQYYAFIKYATNSSGANMTDTPTANTKYVGTYAGTNSSPAAGDYKWSIYVGTNGVSVTQTRELYYLKTNSTDPSQITASNQITTTNRQNGWTSIVPTYVANAEYWTCIETSLSEGGPVWSAPIKNNALTDENYHAWQSLLISQNANENAQGSLSIAQDIHQHFWDNATDYIIPSSNPSFTLPAGAYITDTLIDTFKGVNGPTGGYMLTRSDGLWIGSGKYRLAALTGSALGFYEPGTTLLNSNDETYLDAKLDANGLILKKGGIKAGTVGQSGFIYLSTEDYPLKDEANNIQGLTINGWTPSVTGTREGQLSNDPAWRQVIGTKFGVDSEGNIYAAGGQIGGWHIGMDTNRSLYYENQIPGATTTNLVISSGSEVNTNSIAGSGTNENWFLSAGQKFGVTTDGTLYANNANIRGTIYVGNDVSSLDNAVRIGTNGIVLGNIRGFHIFMDAQDPNSNTYGLGFYETDHRPYVSTKDTTIVQNKNYYQAGSDIRVYDLIDIDAYRAEHPEDLNPNPYSLGWYEEDTSNRDRRIAYINNNELSIPYTVVLKGMKLSKQWVWELNESTKNLTLKWVETED